MKQININSGLLLAEPLPDGSGYTWTLASLLGDMLYMAEKLFGPRDQSYTILGIEFEADGPQIWYPKDCNHIVIQLDTAAAMDIHWACYQLAHETIHLLAPTGGQNANNFEEGLACYFAAYYMEKQLNASNWQPNLPSYKLALELVTPLLNEDIHCVRRLREKQPSFLKMSKEVISAEFPNLTSDKVDFLIKKFDRNST